MYKTLFVLYKHASNYAKIQYFLRLQPPIVSIFNVIDVIDTSTYINSI